MVFILLPLLVIFEIAKRILAIPLYPFAYWDRVKLRANRAAGKSGFLWYVLDDSIVADSILRGAGPLDYCCYGKRAPLAFITERLPDGPFREFMRAWNWGAWRNNCINLSWAMCAGDKKGVLWGIKLGRLVYEERLFQRGLLLPYFEAYIPFTKFRFQCGWISNGRHQVQARSYP